MLRIYPNPRCSKSRAALSLLEAAGKNPDIIKYIDEPVSEDRLRSMLEKFDASPQNLLRENEKEYNHLYK